MLKIREALSDEIELIRNQRGKAHEDHAKVAQLLSPFLPFSSEKVKEMLHLDTYHWQSIERVCYQITQVSLLLERIEINRIEEVSEA